MITEGMINRVTKQKVLIVDDMHTSMFTLVHMLNDEYTILTADTGYGGILAAKDEQPDLILLDVMLPDISGFEVIAALKENIDTKDIPVIFITGQGAVHEEEQGLILGAVDYITKPYSTSIVKMRVQNQLRLFRQEQRIQELSTMDPLTNLVSRKHFNTVLEREWLDTARLRQSMSFLLLNVDAFRNYNERYGQQKGDETLRAISQIVITRHNGVRELVSRWSGDEIAIALPNTDLSKAIEVAQDIINGIEQETQDINSEIQAGLTVSAGVYAVMPKLNNISYIVDDLILDATIALLDAKKTGGNTISSKGRG